MAFFQNSVLNKHLKSLDTEVVKSAYAIFTKYFHNPEIQQNIRNANEEQFQEGFLRELFVNVLGYTLNPQPHYNITTELKNETGAKKADGAILQEGKALAVIELKGTDTKNLDKINDQAFSYKSNHVGCVYVITSNFEKLRFFISNAVDHVEFNLFTLSRQEFELLWLCLSADSLLAGIPLKIKQQSLLADENITRQLYRDYAAFKNEIWQNMVKNQPDNDQLLLFKKTQKLLDRFLFIFFAEDSGLLPPNSISRIVERWKILQEEDAYKPLYEIFQQYFGYINSGRKGKSSQDDIFAYNGGLFFPDIVLDNIVLDDDLLHKHVMKLTAYYFQSEVDVNILGHIFENSLNEIENVTARLAGQAVDKSKTKRKKDGVFYTPKYITKYIVENTVGKLCKEKKAELNITDERFEEASKRSKKGIADLDTYRNWLLKLTICDPACGSGAFLNQALEFLINEHRYLDELTALYHKSSLVLSDIENQILENNLYGVDINEESVDIAKLSLWLRTARRGRKLTTLNNNIKCGNSLIDDPKVAGDKAFSWQKQFPAVFEKGGFDVVIGNPPYVVYIKSVVGEQVLKYVNSRYEFSEYNPNTYALFTDLALNFLIKSNGFLGYIIPNSWLDGQYFSRMRKGVYKKSLDEIVYLKDSVFQEVVETVVLLSQNKNTVRDNIKLSIDVLDNKFEIKEFNLTKFLEGYNPFVVMDNPLLEKLETKYNNLGSSAIVYRGLETRNNKLWLSESKDSENHIPILLGRDVNRYHYKHSGTYVNFVKKEMKSNANETMYLQPKILMRRTGATIIATIENENLFVLKNLYLILPKNKAEIYSMIAQLNSKLLGYYHKAKSSEENKAFAQFKGVYIEGFPYIQSTNEQFKLQVESGVKIVTNFRKNLIAFQKYLLSQFSIEKLSKKLQNWHELEFAEFIAELNKAVKKTGGEKLSKTDEMEWMEVFETKKAEAQTLKAEIDKTDRAIDKMVYELYGLSEEEIRIVEGKNKG